MRVRSLGSSQFSFLIRKTRHLISSKCLSQVASLERFRRRLEENKLCVLIDFSGEGKQIDFHAVDGGHLFTFSPVINSRLA